ncbi:hypothetical protein LguiA_029011 [Lonicera macranthoides]
MSPHLSGWKGNSIIKNYRVLDETQFLLLDVCTHTPCFHNTCFSISTSIKAHIFVQVWDISSFLLLLASSLFSLRCDYIDREKWIEVCVRRPLIPLLINDGIRDEPCSRLISWAIWTRGWTGEENRHGDLLNKHLYLCGRVDMKQVEKTIQYFIGSVRIEWILASLTQRLKNQVTCLPRQWGIWAT